MSNVCHEDQVALLLILMLLDKVMVCTVADGKNDNVVKVVLYSPKQIGFDHQVFFGLR